MSDAPVRAPEFPTDLAWLNTDQPLRLANELRGRVLLLDFWTYCCINCVHMLPELHRLETELSDRPFSVIGVHSPKFDNERDPDERATRPPSPERATPRGGRCRPEDLGRLHRRRLADHDPGRCEGLRPRGDGAARSRSTICARRSPLCSTRSAKRRQSLRSVAQNGPTHAPTRARSRPMESASSSPTPGTTGSSSAITREDPAVFRRPRSRQRGRPPRHRALQ